MSRILVITELFLPTKGGTAIWADEVYRRYGGKELHIVTADVPGCDEFDIGHPNSVHRLDLHRVSWLRPESLLIYLRFFTASFWIGLTRNIEAVHAIRALPEGLVAWLVGRLIFRRVLIYAHGEELTSWGMGAKYRTMRFVLRHCDRVIANSEFTRNELLKLGVQADRISMVHPGVDVERFLPGLPSDDLRKSIGLQGGEYLILSVGRLSRRKGFDMVIKSLPSLLEKGNEIHYALIGIGEDHDYLAGLAGELAVENRVHLLGHVTPEDLPRWYNACDLFAMPNREIAGDTEGFGMVFIEAAACGKPVISGRSGGATSAVVEGVTGLCVDGTSSDDILTAISNLLTDAELASRLGENGRRRVLEEFRWERVTEKTKNLL